ncbi:MAG: hypothetical protein OHK0022_16330 [Roseiflexaceae bacterium]
MITILLVDDQPAVRRGLRMRLALEPDLAVVGEAGDAVAALCLAPALRPRIVLMDIELPQLDGIAVTAALRQSAPASRVIILSLYDSAATRAQALAAGAAAVVGKQEADAALMSAIRRAASA